MVARTISRRGLLFPWRSYGMATLYSQSDVALRTFERPLFVQLVNFNRLLSQLGLSLIDESDPRRNKGTWNQEIAVERESFRHDLAGRFERETRRSTSSSWLQPLQAFLRPVIGPEPQPISGALTIFLYPGCNHLERVGYGGQRAFAFIRHGAIVYHVVSGRCPAGNAAQVSAVQCNTEADKMRTHLQQMAHDPSRILVYAYAKDTNGNIREWMAALTGLLRFWDQLVLTTDSYHALRCRFGLQVALQHEFGRCPVGLLITPTSHLDTTALSREKFFLNHIEGFLSALYDWTEYKNATSADTWLRKRGIIS